MENLLKKRLVVFLDPKEVTHYNSGALFDDTSFCGEKGYYVHEIEKVTCPCRLAEEWEYTQPIQTV